MRELTVAEVALVSGGAPMSRRTLLTLGVVTVISPLAGLGMTLGYYANRN